MRLRRLSLFTLTLLACANAPANIIRNASFETVPCITPCALGAEVLPTEWLAFTLSAETYSHDGSYGLEPGVFGHFIGVTAQDGLRWVAGATFPEILAQLLSEALTAGEVYTMSGWVHRDQSGLTPPAGWQVELWNLAGSTQVIVGEFTPVSGDDWVERSFSFTAPANSASLSYLVLRQISGTGDLAYPGLDNVSLTAAAAPEPSTLVLLVSALGACCCWRARSTKSS